MLVYSIGSMSVLLTSMGFLKLTPLPIVKSYIKSNGKHHHS
jgi:hypothetical protein